MFMNDKLLTLSPGMILIAWKIKFKLAVVL